MKTIYISRNLQSIAVSSTVPGDTYRHPVMGDCRRMTAKRFCLAAERAGKESDAALRLLAAIGEAAVDGVYDGRAVNDWYGLIGVQPPGDSDGMEMGTCVRCGRTHWFAWSELRDLCFSCFHGEGFMPACK